MESGEKKKILVIEDNAGVQTLYREILKRYWYDVEIVENIAEALETLKNKHFDLIILDLQLPGKDGLSFLEETKNLEIDLPPVIVCTGLASVENAVNAMKQGASDFITKPFTVETLVQPLKGISG